MQCIENFKQGILLHEEDALLDALSGQDRKKYVDLTLIRSAEKEVASSFSHQNYHTAWEQYMS